MRYTLMTALLATALALPFTASASAQYASNDVIARCSQAIGQFKFEGYPAERNRDMMMRVCQANGGSIPGAQGVQQERAVSLPHRHPAHQR